MISKVRIQAGDFDIGAELEALAGGTDAGAVASFVGHVRKEDGVTALTLEHYPRMTEDHINGLIAQASARWPLLAATVLHRIGRLLPGDRIVLVAVAASHRRAAFEACEFLTDHLKVHAPFWKEESRGVETQWVSARQSDEEAAARWRK